MPSSLSQCSLFAKVHLRLLLPYQNCTHSATDIILPPPCLAFTFPFPLPGPSATPSPAIGSAAKSVAKGSLQPSNLDRGSIHVIINAEISENLFTNPRKTKSGPFPCPSVQGFRGTDLGFRRYQQGQRRPFHRGDKGGGSKAIPAKKLYRNQKGISRRSLDAGAD